MRSNFKLIIIVYIILVTLLILLPIFYINQSWINGESYKSLERDKEYSIYKENLKTSQSDIIYSENFNDGTADNWTTLGGSWTVENNQYKVIGTSGERVRSYYTSKNFSNYFYEGDFKLVSGSEIQIIFNIQDIFNGADQGHYCQITLFYDDSSYYSRKDTAILYSTQNYQVEHKRVSYDFNYNQWYHFSVISTGTNVDFFLDNSLVLSYSGVYYSSGYIGVKSMYGPIAYFDNIKITDFNNSSKLHINGNSNWVDFKNAGNCTGQGTFSDPYIIEDLIIDAEGLGTCLLIENSDVYFRIENCTMLDSGSFNYTGIKFVNVSNGQLINTTVNGDLYGIKLDYSNNITLMENKVRYNRNCGLFISHSNNTIVLNNFIDHNNDGLRLTNCNNNKVMGNQVWDNKNYGMEIDYSNNNTLSGNIIDNNYFGLRLSYYCKNNTIIGNSVINNDVTGIYLSDSIENNILGNNISYNSYGLGSFYSDNCNISGNLITYNSYGINFYGYNEYNSISKNIITNNWKGISLGDYGYGNNYNNITENTISSNEYGIFLSSSYSNVIRLNLITNNYYGIYLYYSDYNEISNNTFNGNTFDIKEVDYEPYYPNYPSFDNGIIIFIVIIAIIIIIAVVAKNKSSPTKRFRYEYPKEKFQVTKKPSINRESRSLNTSQLKPKSILWEDKVKIGEIKDKEIISTPMIGEVKEDAKMKQPIALKAKREEELIYDKKPSGFCTNCGKPLENTWKICAYCGVKIIIALEEAKIEPKIEKLPIEKEEERPIIKTSETTKIKETPEAPLEEIKPILSNEIRKEDFKDEGSTQSQELRIKEIEKKKASIESMKIEDIKVIEREPVKPKSLKSICPFCGFENILEQKHCKQCGYKLKK